MHVFCLSANTLSRVLYRGYSIAGERYLLSDFEVIKVLCSQLDTETGQVIIKLQVTIVRFRIAFEYVVEKLVAYLDVIDRGTTHSSGS